jgi:hypothetical protein
MGGKSATQLSLTHSLGMLVNYSCIILCIQITEDVKLIKGGPENEQ